MNDTVIREVQSLLMLGFIVLVVLTLLGVVDPSSLPSWGPEGPDNCNYHC